MAEQQARRLVWLVILILAGAVVGALLGLALIDPARRLYEGRFPGALPDNEVWSSLLYLWGPAYGLMWGMVGSLYGALEGERAARGAGGKVMGAFLGCVIFAGCMVFVGLTLWSFIQARGGAIFSDVLLAAATLAFVGLLVVSVYVLSVLGNRWWEDDPAQL